MPLFHSHINCIHLKRPNFWQKTNQIILKFNFTKECRLYSSIKQDLQSKFSICRLWGTNRLWWLHKYGCRRWQIPVATTQQIAICRWKYPKIGRNWNLMTNVSWDGRALLCEHLTRHDCEHFTQLCLAAIICSCMWLCKGVQIQIEIFCTSDICAQLLAISKYIRFHVPTFAKLCAVCANV